MVNYLQSLTPETFDFLISVLGEEHVSIKDFDLDQHSKDESFHEPHRPAVVVWPGSAAEISDILRYANQHRIPVTPWGAGTSLEGNPIPVYGGIVLDTLRCFERRLDRVIPLRKRRVFQDIQSRHLFVRDLDLGDVGFLG